MIKAKKSLGQNFLIDKSIIEKISNVIDIENESILEVGPGTGNLTSFLLKKKPKKFYVVEKDNDLVSILEKDFKNQISIINKDILDIDENFISKDQLIVFGNLPYNISTEILCKWILNINEKKFWFDYLVLMFQKEVADRILAKFNTKNYGRLSILTNWKLKVDKVCEVKPSSFSPKPKVDSSILLFQPKSNFFLLKNGKNLEKLTRVFFMHRRKMLKKPYKIIFNDNLEIAKKLKLDLNLRPQNLNFETYYKLTEEYENLRS